MLRSAAWLIFGITLLLLGVSCTLAFRDASTRTVWSNAAVTSLMWSPDGGTLAIGSADGIILLWDVPQEQARRSIQVESNVVSLAWSPDGRLLASGVWSETDPNAIHVWDTDTGERIQTIEIAAPKLRALSWSPSGGMLSAGLQGNMILFWDLSNDDVQEVTDLSDAVLSLAFSPDGQLLAVGQQDGFVTFMDSANRRPVQSVTYSPDYYVADLSWSPDGQSIASASCFRESDMPANCALVVWNRSSDRYVQSFEEREYDFTSVAWSPSGHFIASAFINGDVRLYNPDTGRRVRTLRTPVGSTLVAWAPDGRTLAAGSEDGSVLLWTIH